MSDSSEHWIPKGVPRNRQIGLAIPGKPPRTLMEFRNRLEAHLIQLAEIEDEDQGVGAAARQAY